MQPPQPYPYPPQGYLAPPPPRRRRRVWGFVAAGAVVFGVIVAILAVLIYNVATQTLGRLHSSNSASGGRLPIPANVYAEVTHVSPSVFAAVGAGPNPNQIIGLPPNTPALTANGRPEIVYIGAEYCPYCAALRWSLVVALSRFGSFTNLRLITSSHTDAYPDTNTFTFYQSSYTSAYLAFSPDEMQDRNQKTLQSPTAQQQQVFSTYDNTPYTQSPEAYPFVDYGNQYITIGGAFLPTNLQGESWQTIAAGLSDPANAATQDILGAANQITAAICLMDHQQPDAVCQTPIIQQLEPKEPTRH